MRQPLEAETLSTARDPRLSAATPLRRLPYSPLAAARFDHQRSSTRPPRVLGCVPIGAPNRCQGKRGEDERQLSVSEHPAGVVVEEDAVGIEAVTNRDESVP